MPASLLSTGRTTDGMLCLALGFPALKRCGCTGAGPEKSHRDDEGIDISVMRGEAQRHGTCYPGEEKVQGDLIHVYNLVDGRVKRRWS